VFVLVEEKREAFMMINFVHAGAKFYTSSMRTRTSHGASTVDGPHDGLFFQVSELASQQRTTKAAQNDMSVIPFHTKTSQSKVLVLTPRNRRERSSCSSCLGFLVA
jgi:hypothetical protein